jgi:(5-formylfuran-3-yl)methyl phosphate synthase
MTRLLVSVRDADEAERALAGGADLVDVKEPTRGALGRADDDVVAEVVERVAGRRPVSAALGELRGWREPLPPAGLTFVKWDLAGYARTMHWWEELAALSVRVEQGRPGCRPVAVAYADWQRAEAPAPEAVCACAVQLRLGALMLDTWAKDGTTLLDWLSEDAIAQLARACRAAGVALALAGALTTKEIVRLRGEQADWIAVRGAACAEGERTGGIVLERVRALAALLGED